MLHGVTPSDEEGGDDETGLECAAYGGCGEPIFVGDDMSILEDACAIGCAEPIEANIAADPGWEVFGIVGAEAGAGFLFGEAAVLAGYNSPTGLFVASLYGTGVKSGSIGMASLEENVMLGEHQGDHESIDVVERNFGEVTVGSFSTPSGSEGAFVVHNVGLPGPLPHGFVGFGGAW